MAYITIDLYSSDGTQLFKIYSEAGTPVIEYSVKDSGDTSWKFITSFYFESLRDVELFKKACQQVVENDKLS